MPDEHHDDPAPSPRGHRGELSEAALDALLRLLDPDRDEAGRKYELLRLKLIKFFRARKSPDPDEDADKTIDRVCSKIINGEQVRSVSAYSLT
ncbi:MAG: hypothetical protein ACREDR_27390, partial [Blastocatellia bacterium]